jgi:hypothetical protein
MDESLVRQIADVGLHTLSLDGEATEVLLDDVFVGRTALQVIVLELTPRPSATHGTR